jgi:hypothetical protein
VAFFVGEKKVLAVGYQLSAKNVELRLTDSPFGFAQGRLGGLSPHFVGYLLIWLAVPTFT